MSFDLWNHNVVNNDKLVVDLFFCLDQLSFFLKLVFCFLCAFTSTAFFEYKEDGGRFPNPPSYSVATTLPSYDEAERSKEEAAVPLVAGRVMVELIFTQQL